MEYMQKLKRQQSESNILIALNKQIEALTPLRISYQNLLHYRQKVSLDLDTLIDQHDYALSSLKYNLQNLTAMLIGTQAEKNNLNIELRDRQNDLAKILLDTRNMAQKFQSLNQKLSLEGHRTEQNLSFKDELYKIEQTLRMNIINTQLINQQLLSEQPQLLKNQSYLEGRIQIQMKKKVEFEQYNEKIKEKIAKINVKNDDLIDGNRKLEQEVKCIQDQYKVKQNINREFKQKIIQQKTTLEKIKSHIQDTSTLLNSQNTSNFELSANFVKLQGILLKRQVQYELIWKENSALDAQIQKQSQMKISSITSKQIAQNYLTELKRTNNMFLSKMEHYCMQDKEIENLLLKKMVCLDFFAKKINQKYQQEQQNRIRTLARESQFLKQKILSVDELRLFQDKLNKIQIIKNSDEKENTKSSQSSWVKQNTD